MFARTVKVLLIFAAGAALGLGGAWWLDRQNEPPMSAVVKPRAATQAQPVQPVPTAPLSARTGIPPSELPYDGKLPHNEVGASSAAAAPSSGSSGAAPTAPALAERMPPPPAAISPSPVKEAAVSQAPPPAPEKPADAKAELREQDGSKAAPALEAGKKGAEKPSVAERPSREEKTPKLRHSASAEKKAASAPRRTSSASKAVNNHEIERMREEAAAELKKKIDARAEKPSSNGEGAKSKRAALERCERVPSLIGREMCKWEACNGMWGKNGCPSFEKTVGTY